MLGLNKRQVVTILGKSFKIITKEKGKEEIRYYTDNPKAEVLKKYGSVAYFIKCVFEKNKLTQYNFGFNILNPKPVRTVEQISWSKKRCQHHPDTPLGIPEIMRFGFTQTPIFAPAGLIRPAPAELPQDRKVARVGGCSGAM